jgi:hypothetical protein
VTITEGLKGEMTVPNNFHEEDDEINGMFYGK